jgi:hypothetical protein
MNESYLILDKLNRHFVIELFAFRPIIRADPTVNLAVESGCLDGFSGFLIKATEI